MKCQRFAAAERAAAERQRAMSASGRLARSKERLMSWLGPSSSSEVVPLLLLALAALALLLAVCISRPEWHGPASIAPAIAPRQQSLWRSLMLRKVR